MEHEAADPIVVSGLVVEALVRLVVIRKSRIITYEGAKFLSSKSIPEFDGLVSRACSYVSARGFRRSLDKACLVRTGRVRKGHIELTARPVN